MGCSHRQGAISYRWTSSQLLVLSVVGVPRSHTDEVRVLYTVDRIEGVAADT